MVNKPVSGSAGDSPFIAVDFAERSFDGIFL